MSYNLPGVFCKVLHVLCERGLIFGLKTHPPPSLQLDSGSDPRISRMRTVPPVGCVVVLDARLDVLQLIQDREHIEEPGQGQQVGLRYKGVLALARALHSFAELVNGHFLQLQTRVGETQTVHWG